MFALRRFAVTTSRSASHPAVPLVSSFARYTRPHSLSELRALESQMRWNSTFEGGENPGNAGLEDMPNRFIERPFGYRRLGEELRREDRPPVAPTRVLYVGNLKYECTEQELQEKFSEFGTIRGMKIPRTGQDGVTRGFAYIEYDTLSDAAEAIEAMNQAPFHGRRLNVQYVNRGDTRIKENPESKTLFIGNLSFNTTDDDLNELFKDIAGCVDVRVAMDRRTGQPRGFIHADFTDVPSAVAARERLTGTQLYGRTIRIDYSVPPEERKRNWEERQREMTEEFRPSTSSYPQPADSGAKPTEA